MGCDIHCFTEVFRDGKWEFDDYGPFDDRNYSLFGLLAGVRNYSAVTPIDEPRGIPKDACGEVTEYFDRGGYHSASWFLLQELIDYDWDQIIEDRRCDVTLPSGCVSGAGTCHSGEGESMSARDFVGGFVTDQIDRLHENNQSPVRIVFFFDS